MEKLPRFLNLADRKVTDTHNKHLARDHPEDKT